VSTRPHIVTYSYLHVRRSFIDTLPSRDHIVSITLAFVATSKHTASTFRLTNHERSSIMCTPIFTCVPGPNPHLFVETEIATRSLLAPLPTKLYYSGITYAHRCGPTRSTIALMNLVLIIYFIPLSSRLSRSAPLRFRDVQTACCTKRTSATCPLYHFRRTPYHHSWNPQLLVVA